MMAEPFAVPALPEPPTLAVMASAAQGPVPEFAAELLTLFFRHLHPLPSYSFLHESTVSRRHADGSLSEPLALAVCSITALLLGHHSAHHSQWIARAEEVIFAALHRPSVLHVQALLLVVRYHAASGAFARAYMLAGLASRAAFGLRLHYEHSEIVPVAQELRRRTFWSLYLLDDLFCVGLNEYELCRSETVQLELPRSSLEDVSGPPVYLAMGQVLEPDVMGREAAIMRLAAIRRSIMKLTRRVLARDSDLRVLLAEVIRFESELRQLQGQLLEADRYPQRDLSRFQWQSSYLMLHVSWHQCHCDLYRLFVSGYTEASPLSILESMSPNDQLKLREKCFKHAESIAQLLSEFLRQNDTVLLLELDTAVCAYHCARLILYGTCTLKKDLTDSLDKQRAIGMARISFDLIDRYFANVMCSKPMVRQGDTALSTSKFADGTQRNDLESLIRRYSISLTDESNEAVPNIVEDVSPASQVSTAAIARQKLSVHSLLLQSDFVDDSRDAVMAAQDHNTHRPNDLSDMLSSGAAASQSNADIAVDPLFGNLDPFGMLYWDGLMGGVQGLEGQSWEIAGDVDGVL